MSFVVSTLNPETHKVEYRQVRLTPNGLTSLCLRTDRDEEWLPGQAEKPRWAQRAIAMLSRGLLDDRYFFGRAPQRCPICLKEKNNTCRGWICPNDCERRD